VYAAAVILPAGFRNKLLNDSKKLTADERYKLRPVIEAKAISWAVGIASTEEIDSINILNASFLAMHRAIEKLSMAPGLLLIDGPLFRNKTGIRHQCIVEGDSLYASIAAASILAKTYRDDHMTALHEKFPHYSWNTNKGYATFVHREAIGAHGTCMHHRRSFHLADAQAELEFPAGESL
jgi:ribonuclease HII